MPNLWKDYLNMYFIALLQTKKTQSENLKKEKYDNIKKYDRLCAGAIGIY